MSEPTTKFHLETTQTDPELRAMDVIVQVLKMGFLDNEQIARVARYVNERFGSRSND